MFKNIPLILSAEELLDKAFKKAKKKQIADKNPFYKKKKTIIARMEIFAAVITNTLDSYVKEFPSIEELPMFYQDLINIQINVDKLRKSLGAVQWAKNTCWHIYQTQVKSLRKSSQIDFLMQKQREIYGRMSSVVKQIDEPLLLLAKAQRFMKSFPDISDIPTVVIAGYPNVGKSSLLKALSKAKPQIAQYPFTTKHIHVGHLEKTTNYITTRIQLIDTPGLLDKPLSKQRNNIEQQAIAALKNLADVIIFLLDPTETCGYSLQDQEKLLASMKKLFSEVPLILVENKSDIKKTSSSNHKISCKTKEGINELIDVLFSFTE